MKIKVLLISCVLLTSIIIVAIFVDKDDKVVFESGKSNTIVRSNALTVMYETEADSGEYQVSTENIWPGDEYIFNETLSKCENGGILTWNDENKKVLLQTNISDKCYVYFDKYSMPQITNVEATNITSNSITVNVTASGGDGNVVKYHYSINNGEYISSNSNSYTYENLNAETSYNINVYVTDSNGRKSSSHNANFTTLSDLISFTVTDESTSIITTYYAEKGMTWQKWVNSDYNTDNFTIPEMGVCVNGHSLMGTYYTDVIEDGANFIVSSRFTCAQG